MNVKQSGGPAGAQLNIFSQMCVLVQFVNPVCSATLVLPDTPGMSYGQYLDAPNSVSTALSSLLFFPLVPRPIPFMTHFLGTQ